MERNEITDLLLRIATGWHLAAHSHPIIGAVSREASELIGGISDELGGGTRTTPSVERRPEEHELRSPAWSMSNSMKPRSRSLVDGLRQRRFRLDQFELRGKFVGTETWPTKALSLAGAVIEGVEVSAFVVVGAGLGR